MTARAAIILGAFSPFGKEYCACVMHIGRVSIDVWNAMVFPTSVDSIK
jgi:hypothetical protein